jgi:serine/threonine protein kinase
MDEEATEKLLQDEGFELVSPDVDRGAHSVVFRCRVVNRSHAAHHSGRDEAGREHEENNKGPQHHHHGGVPHQHRHLRDAAAKDAEEQQQQKSLVAASSGASREEQGKRGREADEDHHHHQHHNHHEGGSVLEEGQMVRIKVLNVSLPLPRHLTNFQHEHQVVASLRDVEGVVRVVARLSRPGVEALVLEDFGGASLDKWLAREGGFAARGLEGIRTFLEMALTVARTLGHIHSRAVVHKDLKVHLAPPNPY